MFNQAILIGNLTADPELKKTNTGKSVCTFRLATNKVVGRGEDRQELATFHNIVTWEGLAETCGQYLSKGRKVHVVGEIQNRTWEKEDGTKGYASEINARTVNFLSPNDGSGNNNGSEPTFSIEEFADV